MHGTEPWVGTGWKHHHCQGVMCSLGTNRRKWGAETKAAMRGAEKGRKVLSPSESFLPLFYRRSLVIRYGRLKEKSPLPIVGS